METNGRETNPALTVLKALGAVAFLVLLISTATSKRNETKERSVSSASAGTVSEQAKPTLDDRPTYKGLKPPVREFNTPGSDVKELRLPAGRVYVGQKMLAAMDILPSAEREDAEDDPEITITSPFGNHVGMRYVNRYLLPDGHAVVVRFQRKVPKRPYVGEAGSVQHPFVVHRITIQQ